MKEAITVEGVSKKYLIWHEDQAETTMVGSMARGAASLVTTIRDSLRHGMGVKGGAVKEDFWALQDVNLSINHGERVGIIGRNGAGKSTLLKILSRITPPTTGQIKINGRVASLLEVGTGFHQELSGRENIFLNGVIMGMRHNDIKRRIDEIIAFSGIEKFIDTPVKRYSSGMYVRLAFAVSAHLDPEILLVDEVLAVGDFEFQRKCLGKMDALSGEGRTIVFVSHQLDAVKRLVNRCVLMEQGTIIASGDPPDIIHQYLSDKAPLQGRLLFKERPKLDAQILEASIIDGSGATNSFLEPGVDLEVQVRFVIRDPLAGSFRVTVFLMSEDDEYVWYADSSEYPSLAEMIGDGEQTLRVVFQGGVLQPGRYIVRPVIERGHKSYHNHPNVNTAMYEGGLELEIVDRAHNIEEQTSKRKRKTGVIALMPTMYKEEIDATAS